MVDRLADTAPADLVILIALGFTTWLANKALNVLDRHINPEGPR